MKHHVFCLLSTIGLSLFLILGLLFLLSTTAQAAPSATISLDVDTTIDSNALEYQACTSAVDDCSLRGAISRANVDPGNDYVINLPEGTFLFTLSGSGEDSNATGDLDLSGQITLRGVAAISTTIDANQRDRGLHVFSGAAVTLENLSITNGKAPDGADGGTGAAGGAGAGGGGIFNSGALTLTQVTLSANETGSGGDGGDESITPFCSGRDSGERGGNGGSGGGLYNAGILTLNESSVFGNSTGKGGIGGFGGICIPLGSPGDFGPGGDAGHGGGIFNEPSATVTIINTTINDNSTGDGGEYIGTEPNNEGGGDGGSGAGIYNAGLITITTSTISGNLTGNGGDSRDSGAYQGPVGSGGHGGALFNAGTAMLENLTISLNRTGTTGSQGFIRPGTTDGMGAGVYADSGSVSYQNSIIAGNDSPVDTSDDCNGTLTSGGYNLVGSGTGCPVGGSDQTTTNALLGPLADNGGETRTHALLAGSPAINRIPDGVNGCVANTSTDQREAVRAGGSNRGGAACDIGAYEYASDETPNAVMLVAFQSHSLQLEAGIWLISIFGIVILGGGWLWLLRMRKFNS